MGVRVVLSVRRVCCDSCVRCVRVVSCVRVIRFAMCANVVIFVIRVRLCSCCSLWYWCSLWYVVSRVWLYTVCPLD